MDTTKFKCPTCRHEGTLINFGFSSAFVNGKMLRRQKYKCTTCGHYTNFPIRPTNRGSNGRYIAKKPTE